VGFRAAGDRGLFLGPWGPKPVSDTEQQPRDTYDTQLLLHKLENGYEAEFDPNQYEKDTERFTQLTSKHAAHVSVVRLKGF